MSQLNKNNRNRSKIPPHIPKTRGKPISFDELVVGGSLPRVKIKIYPSRRKDKARSNDKLLIELQCEV